MKGGVKHLYYAEDSYEYIFTNSVDISRDKLLLTSRHYLKYVTNQISNKYGTPEGTFPFRYLSEKKLEQEN